MAEGDHQYPIVIKGVPHATGCTNKAVIVAGMGAPTMVHQNTIKSILQISFLQAKEIPITNKKEIQTNDQKCNFT